MKASATSVTWEMWGVRKRVYDFEEFNHDYKPIDGYYEPLGYCLCGDLPPVDAIMMSRAVHDQILAIYQGLAEVPEL